MTIKFDNEKSNKYYKVGLGLMVSAVPFFIAGMALKDTEAGKTMGKFCFMLIALAIASIVGQVKDNDKIKWSEESREFENKAYRKELKELGKIESEDLTVDEKSRKKFLENMLKYEKEETSLTTTKEKDSQASDKSFAKKFSEKEKILGADLPENKHKPRSR